MIDHVDITKLSERGLQLQLARLGLRAAFVGRVGDDEAGRVAEFLGGQGEVADHPLTVGFDVSATNCATRRTTCSGWAAVS